MTDIPHLRRHDIESIAEQVLLWAKPKHFDEPRLTPLAEIVEKLILKGKMRLCLDRPLGRTPEGKKILGVFLPQLSAIYIDPSIDQNGPRFRFTLAHELGHFVLHRKLKLLGAGDTDNASIDDSRHDLHGHWRTRPHTDREWLEWQANAFASALLMPRVLLRAAIIDKQKELGISRNLGRIYVDKQWHNVLAYRAIVMYLQSTFIVSRTVVRIRLKNLRLLQNDQCADVAHVSAHLNKLFRQAA